MHALCHGGGNAVGRHQKRWETLRELFGPLPSRGERVGLHTG